MSGSPVFPWALESCTSYMYDVLCPHRTAPATITVVKWESNDARWTLCAVVDCSLMPAGQMHCEMSCLSQVNKDSA